MSEGNEWDSLMMMTNDDYALFNTDLGDLMEQVDAAIASSTAGQEASGDVEDPLAAFYPDAAPSDAISITAAIASEPLILPAEEDSSGVGIDTDDEYYSADESLRSPPPPPPPHETDPGLLPSQAQPELAASAISTPLQQEQQQPTAETSTSASAKWYVPADRIEQVRMKFHRGVTASGIFQGKVTKARASLKARKLAPKSMGVVQSKTQDSMALTIAKFDQLGTDSLVVISGGGTGKRSGRTHLATTGNFGNVLDMSVADALRAVHRPKDFNLEGASESTSLRAIIEALAVARSLPDEL